jgi:hypothetical protein
VTLVVLVLGSLLVLGRFAHWSAIYSTIPYESGKTDAQLVTQQIGRPKPIFSIHTSIAFDYYLGNRPRAYRVRNLKPATASRVVCHFRGSFTFAAQVGHRDPAALCLRRRHAIEFIAPQRRPGGLVVWLVPPQSSARRHRVLPSVAVPRSTSKAPI